MKKNAPPARSAPISAPSYDPSLLISRKRAIKGMSAILLPFLENQEIDWPAFVQHLERTARAGLVPAVNMDTGYVNLLDEKTKTQVLKITNEVLAGEPFIAGAYVSDRPAAGRTPFAQEAYAKEIGQIEKFNGTPILFQSYGLAHQPNEIVLENYYKIAQMTDRFLAFELGTMFADFGKIYDLALFKELIQIPQCVGAKHSSLKRDLEWQRLEIRNQVRPDFMLLTGNDLAIDMVMYGSDYLLGLSSFCPEVFAKRDAMWLAGEDEGFFRLNDLLQYLGCFAFRTPTSAYKHSAAMFLKLQGSIKTNQTHPLSATRPDSDLEVLADILQQLEQA